MESSKTNVGIVFYMATEVSFRKDLTVKSVSWQTDIVCLISKRKIRKGKEAYIHNEIMWKNEDKRKL